MVLIGNEKTYAKKIRAYIAENDMETQVHFLKGIPMQELAVIYQLATLFCYPSIFEGFGIPVIEALYSRTPVITNKEGCFPEAGGPHSSYVDPTNVEALTKAIMELWNDPKKQEEMAKLGHAYAQRFNDDVIAANVMKVYQDVLQS